MSQRRHLPEHLHQAAVRPPVFRKCPGGLIPGAARGLLGHPGSSRSVECDLVLGGIDWPAPGRQGNWAVVATMKTAAMLGLRSSRSRERPSRVPCPARSQDERRSVHPSPPAVQPGRAASLATCPQPRRKRAAMLRPRLHRSCLPPARSPASTRSHRLRPVARKIRKQPQIHLRQISLTTWPATRAARPTLASSGRRHRMRPSTADAAVAALTRGRFRPISWPRHAECSGVWGFVPRVVARHRSMRNNESVPHHELVWKSEICRWASQ